MATAKSTVEETASSQDEATPVVPKLSDRYADESYKLLSRIKIQPPTPQEGAKIRKKCVRWVVPFICLGYHLMYVDKQTVRNPLSPEIMEVSIINVGRMPYWMLIAQRLTSAC